MLRAYSRALYSELSLFRTSMWSLRISGLGGRGGGGAVVCWDVMGGISSMSSSR